MMKDRKEFKSLHEEAVYLLELANGVLKSHTPPIGSLVEFLIEHIDAFFVEYNTPTEVLANNAALTIDDLL